MSLHAKLAEVMAEAGRIPKNGKAPAEMGGYQFVQVGDAADAIRQALGTRGVSMLPSALDVVSEGSYETKSGKSIGLMTVRTTWTLTDSETGETAVIQSLGTGGDSGDKASPKAQTNAMKYALLMGFLLSTGDDPEGAGHVEDRAGRTRADVDRADDGSLIGTLEVGDRQTSDFLLRQTPEGPVIGFRLRGQRGGILVRCRGELAVQLDAFREAAAGATVTCWGALSEESFKPKSGRQVTYQLLVAERVSVPGVGVLPTDATPEPDAAPGASTGLSEAESEAIWAEMDARGGVAG